MKKTFFTQKQLESRIEIAGAIYNNIYPILSGYARADFEKINYVKDRKMYNNAYPYIAFNDIKAILKTINKFPNARSFADLGCGVPILAVVVKAVFPILNVYGFEIRRDIIHACRCVSSITLREADILSLEKETIQALDIIYFFRPIESQELMHKLIDKLNDECKLGQIILPVYGEKPLNIHAFRPIHKHGEYIPVYEKW